MQHVPWRRAILLSFAASSLAMAAQTAPAPTAANPGPLTLPAGTIPQTAAPGQTQIVAGKRALAAKHFLEAKGIFSKMLASHPDNVEAELGLADAELGLHEYETAEIEYRKVVFAQPMLWQAHKNLVIVEAALGRWSEFDRERELLRVARERGFPGISARESDIIDGFDIHGEPWIVREYFEPVGRSLTRYNFEHFSPTGRAEEYISLESNPAADDLIPGGAVAIGKQAAPSASADFVLNWYTGKGHGTIKNYGPHEPDYERVRADVLHWLRQPKETSARR